jgi:HK97 family phage major capsid protein
MPSLLEQSRELRQKRAKLIKETRELALVDKPTDEQKTEYEARMDDVQSLKDQYERLERQHELETGINESMSEEDVEDRSRREGDEGTAKERRAQEIFNRYLQQGERGLTSEEFRALQSDSDEAGGFLVAPQKFVEDLIQAVDDQLWIRQLATKEMVVTAKSLGVASLDADPADADWTTELAIGSEDSTMDFGNREFVPHPIAKLLKVSRKLLRQAPRTEGIVRERLAYKFAVTQEKAFLTGSGASQPLGLFTASAQGISTGRDVSTGNTTTSITTDGLTEAKYTLKGNYWGAARWLFHRDAIKQIAKLKDGEGQYLWRESVRAGEPDRLLGLPLMSSEYAPNTFTTGLYVGLLGDFSNYWVVDALDMELQRLDELYAATHQVGFVGRMETDGMPVLEEAFVRVKLA